MSASSDPTRREMLAAEFLNMAANALSAEGAQYEAFKTRYRRDPVGFITECVEWNEGEALTNYQTEVIYSLTDHGRVAVRGPHGLGKTCMAALLTLWFALTRDGEDWKAISTASAWRQLSKYLWPEIHKWSGRLKWDVIGRRKFSERNELFTLSLKLKTGEAFAVSSDDPGLVEGAHADHVLLIIDEGKSVPSPIWDAFEGLLAGGGEVLALAISTPGAPTGRFYDIHCRKVGLEDWNPIHVTLDQCIAAGRVSQEWADQRARQWGEASAVYQNRVLGQFCTSDDDAVIPLSWVEAAVNRWNEWKDAGGEPDSDVVGVDVSRSGLDKTVLALRKGSVITELRRYVRGSTMETTGHVVRVLDRFTGSAVVDVIGVGAGVLDRLRELKYKSQAFNSSESTDQRDRSGELRFLNRRAAAWWRIRELLDPDLGSTVALPEDDQLIGDLTTPTWWVTSTGKVQIESKDEIRKRLGRSTDAGDAVVMAFSTFRDASRMVPIHISVEKRRWNHKRGGRWRVNRLNGRWAR